jgi:putative cro-like protein|nr:MAG TPA: Cro/C1-type HTH DNA-binding domain protein [Caudoviricetes sp.]DAP41850.1 MAG TPA: Cro/C1-type HTH DNA-binding domain protein [Caudoviricetes sp.]
MNIRKLKAKLVERDVSIADLASILNVDKSTVYRKFNKSGESFTVSDVDKIAKALSLTYKDINEIFFTNVVA